MTAGPSAPAAGDASVPNRVVRANRKTAAPQHIWKWERALQNRRRSTGIRSEGLFERGENDKQYFGREEIFEGGSAFLCSPVDDVMIKKNYVQIEFFL